jgi:hypothetical protein
MRGNNMKNPSRKRRVGSPSTKSVGVSGVTERREDGG